MNVEKKLSRAKKLVKQGQPEQAVALYQEILSAFPKNKTAQQALAQLSSVPGNSQSVQIENHLRQLMSFFEGQKFTQAISLGNKLLEAGVKHIMVHNVLAAAYASTGQSLEAVKHFEVVVKLNPDYGEGHNNLGTAYIELGRFDRAIGPLREAVRLKKNWPDPLYNLAVAYASLNKSAEAIQAYELVLGLNPDSINAVNNLSIQYSLQGRHEQAIALLTRLIDKGVESAQLYSSRGTAYTNQFNYAAAEQDFLKAEQLRPDFGGFYQGYGDLLLKQKRNSEAVSLLEKGAFNLPFASGICSTLLFTQCYSNNESSESSFRVAKKFGDESINLAKLHGQVRDAGNILKAADEPIKVGYVSADFCGHSVAWFFEPVIESHSARVETYCYANNIKQDHITERIKSKSNHWRDVLQLSDSQLCEQIKADGIHILVDMSGHSDGNRLPVFAAKPAPIQVTWLGYADTTGLPTIDYRLVDAISDPVDAGDAYYSEKLFRLPGPFLSYQGEPDIAGADDIPFKKNNYITFGSFNNLNKVTTDVTAAWSRILNKVPNSKLVLKAPAFKEARLVEFYLDLFAAHGITAEQLIFLQKTKTTQEHLELYSQVDLCLDTFPYNGTTTTCEALWMGVPVVTYAGKRHAARVSASILHHTELDDWVAADVDDFVELAVAKAADVEALAELRGSLRKQVQASALCDHKTFVSNMEQAYEQMIEQYQD